MRWCFAPGAETPCYATAGRRGSRKSVRGGARRGRKFFFPFTKWSNDLFSSPVTFFRKVMTFFVFLNCFLTEQLNFSTLTWCSGPPFNLRGGGESPGPAFSSQNRYFYLENNFFGAKGGPGPLGPPLDPRLTAGVLPMGPVGDFRPPIVIFTIFWTPFSNPGSATVHIVYKLLFI